MITVWVLGDQLTFEGAGLVAARPDTHRVLMVESTAKLHEKRWHRQRAHFILSAMRHFAQECRDRGFTVDYRFAPSLTQGLRAHIDEFAPDAVVAMECMSRRGNEMLRAHNVRVVPNNQFLCHPDEFASWAAGRKQFTMEHFYRWQRTRLGLLMDGDQPEGGRWNFDADNREPPPKDGKNHWPQPPRDSFDSIDLAVLDDLAGAPVWGEAPDGTWATTRAGALGRLHHFINNVLPQFGPHEDAMTSASWHVAHSLLAHYLNVGLLHPMEEIGRAHV